MLNEVQKQFENLEQDFKVFKVEVKMKDWQMAELSNQYKNEMNVVARESRLARSAQDQTPNRFGLFVASTVIFLSVLVWFVF